MGSIIEIKCNKCGFFTWIYYGGGYLGQENNFYYCPKCFRIKNYPTNELEFKPIEFESKPMQIKKCGYCRIKRKPFILEFKEDSPEIKGPAGYKCPECGSSDLVYEDVGCWD